MWVLRLNLNLYIYHVARLFDEANVTLLSINCWVFVARNCQIFLLLVMNDVFIIDDRNVVLCLNFNVYYSQCMYENSPPSLLFAFSIFDVVALHHRSY